jgi:hypothetical protein
MYAVKVTNLLANGIAHFIPAKGYADACQTRRIERAAIGAFWEEGTEFTVEVEEVEDDFDFEGQSDWN